MVNGIKPLCNSHHGDRKALRIAACRTGELVGKRANTSAECILFSALLNHLFCMTVADLKRLPFRSCLQGERVTLASRLTLAGGQKIGLQEKFHR